MDFTEARDSDWQWHQLCHMQGCTPLQTNNHDSTTPHSFYRRDGPSCHPTNSIKALKTTLTIIKPTALKCLFSLIINYNNNSYYEITQLSIAYY